MTASDDAQRVHPSGRPRTQQQKARRWSKRLQLKLKEQMNEKRSRGHADATVEASDLTEDDDSSDEDYVFDEENEEELNEEDEEEEIDCREYHADVEREVEGFAEVRNDVYLQQMLERPTMDADEKRWIKRFLAARRAWHETYGCSIDAIPPELQILAWRLRGRHRSTMDADEWMARSRLGFLLQQLRLLMNKTKQTKTDVSTIPILMPFLALTLLVGLSVGTQLYVLVHT